MRYAILLALVGCAPKPHVLSPAHPAHPAAPIGRLAGPPPALRPGVVEMKPGGEVPPAPPAPPHHH